MRYPHKQQGFSNLQPLTYSKLEREKREIRLLTIHPGSWRARIRCTLTTASLNDNPVYNALSYVWGSPHDTVPIFVNGRVFHATVNLWRALRRVRRATSPFTVWVDAICINQRDNVEKSWQVAMMNAIYANCFWSVVWLGEDAHAQKRGKNPRPRSKTFRLAVQLLKMLTQDKHYADYPCYELTSGGGIVVAENYQQHFKCLQTLLAADWWHRIWVVQEIVLPQRVLFLAGSEKFHIPIIERAYVRAGKHGMDCCRWAWQKLHAPAPSGPFFKAVVDLLTVFWPFATAAFYRLPGSGQLSLRRLREVCGHMDATVAHDHVYGVLALVTSWGEATPPVPDYTRPVADTVVQAVLSMVDQERSFCALHGSRDLLSRDGIPSWVPDYAMGHDHTSTRYPLLESFKASGTHFERPVLVDRFILQVKAVGIDQVEKVGRAVTNPDTLCPALEEWREILGADVAGEKSQPKMEQFWNALLRATLSSNKLRQTYGWDWSDVSWSVCEDDYQRFREACARQDDSKGPFVSLLSQHKTGASYKESVSKRMFFTKTGKFGLARYSVEVGDEIYLPIGGKAPFVLRRSSTTAHQIVSECFLEGFMDGELMEGDWQDRLEDILVV
ncbi:Heterokaryon incompatibility [Lasiodiplodia theobromae]|nr:Heterokaryon incompatibility [Lasiodiplodia theobromae]